MATESFFSNASLAYLASAGAGKDGKAYSIKPTDGTGDFTFSRGSNLAATRVGADGLIEKGRENILLQSNGFNTGWTIINGASVTSGQSGYDGTNDGWLLSVSSISYSSIYRPLSMSGVYTASIYAKAGSFNYLMIRDFRGSGDGNWFDLSNSTIASTTSNCIDAKIESVGNGWYRCSITQNFSGTGYLQVSASDTTSSPSSVSGNIYIQDAQIEIGLAATDVIETGATTGKAGLLEDEPRFDYSGGATCPSLLLEPSRTNIWPYSEYLDFGVDSDTDTTITQNTTETLSPEGLYNATKLEGVGAWIFRENIGSTGTGTWTISCWVKAVNASSNNTFRLSVGGNNLSSDLTATTEWKKFDFTFTNGGGSSTGFMRDSSSNDADLYIYGVQVEEGSYPTSYIPNHSGGSVTRGEESFSATGLANYLGDSEGTLYIEGEQFENAGFVSILETENSGVSIGSTGANTFLLNVRVAGTNQADIQSGVIFSANTNFKLAGKYKANDFEFFKDGASVGTDTSGTTFGDGDLIKIQSNSSFAADQPFYGRIKQILVFPEALSEADCIALTTL